MGPWVPRWEGLQRERLLEIAIYDVSLPLWSSAHHNSNQVVGQAHKVTHLSQHSSILSDPTRYTYQNVFQAFQTEHAVDWYCSSLGSICTCWKNCCVSLFIRCLMQIWNRVSHDIACARVDCRYHSIEKHFSGARAVLLILSSDTTKGDTQTDWTSISASVFSIDIHPCTPEKSQTIKCGTSSDLNAQEGITQLEWTIQTHDNTNRVVWDLSNVNGDPFNAEGFHATVNTSDGGDCRGSVCPPGEKCPPTEIYQYHDTDLTRPGPIRPRAPGSEMGWHICRQP